MNHQYFLPKNMSCADAIGRGADNGETLWKINRKGMVVPFGKHLQWIWSKNIKNEWLFMLENTRIPENS